MWRTDIGMNLLALVGLELVVGGRKTLIFLKASVQML